MPMSFVYPAFLFGLFSLAIPIIIHLFNFRRYKKVYFTNVKFLEQLKQESQSKSKLKNLLILFSRLLALTCLVFAFAQPFIPAKNSSVKAGSKAISVYIDNSFSMEAVSKNGLLLEVAKNKAREIAAAFNEADKFQILTNDFEGKHQRLVSREEFLQMLDEIEVSPAFHSISEVAARQKDLLNSSAASDKRTYLVSDFQKSMADILSWNKDSVISATLIPVVANNAGNVYIDSLWFGSPVQQAGLIQKLNVKVVNNSDNSIENGVIKLFVNDKLIAPASFKSEPQSTVNVEISYLLRDEGIQQCRVEIEDHPVVFDDVMYFSSDVRKNIPSLVISGESPSTAYISALMKNDSLFSYSEMNVKAIDFSAFTKSDFIILNGIREITSGLATELKKFTASGGTILIIPGSEIDLASYNAAFAQLNAGQFSAPDTADTKADKINYAQGLYDGVFEKKQENIDLPRVFMHYSSSSTVRSGEEVIIRLLNGKPFLSLYQNGSGKVYISTVPLDDNASNFARHALFVPTIIRMAINSKPVIPLYYIAGTNQSIQIKESADNKEEVFHIADDKAKFDLIPESRKQMGLINLFTHNQLRQAGNYKVKAGVKDKEGISFNYSRKESDLSVYNPEELKKLISEKGIKGLSLIEPGEKSISDVVMDLTQGTRLWKLFVILTLVFLLIEVLLIRFFK